MKAGFASADITPRLGVQLAGYGPYRNRAANKIFAPLFARALAVTDGRRRAILVNVELCGTPRPLAILQHSRRWHSMSTTNSIRIRFVRAISLCLD